MQSGCAVTGFISPVADFAIEVADRALHLSWQMRDTADVDGYKIYRADSLGAGFSLIDSTTGRLFIDSDLQNSHQYYYRISAINISGREGSHSSTASGMPNLYSVVVNNGQNSTNSRTVNLTMVAPATTQLMRIANTADFGGSAWEIYTASRQWLLAASAGLKTVYVMFRDANGNNTAGYLSDDITLEILPYQYSIAVNNGALYAYSRNVTLTLSAPAGTSYMKISTNPNFASVNWENYIASKNWFIDSQTGNNGDTVVFYARFQDQNRDSVAVQASDSIALAFANPVELFPVNQQPDQYRTVSLSWTPSLSTDFRSYRIFRSLGTASVDTLVGSINAIATTSFIDSVSLVSLPDTISRQIYYMIRFYSTFDDSSDSDTIRVSLRNNQPPAINCFVSNVSYNTDTTHHITNMSATLGWSRSEITDFSHYVVYESTSPSSGTARPTAYLYDRATLSFAIAKNNVDTLAVFHYWLKVFDQGGQSSAFSQPDSVRRR